jgi:Protein of unknown function (DUF2946)
VNELRKFVGLLAIFGVLLHAGLIVRHNSSMVASQLDVSPSFASFICHGDGSETQFKTDVGSVPGEERDSRDGTCPLCAGFGSAVAVLAQPSSIGHIHRATKSLRVAVVAEVVARRMAGDRPPTRGPPILV